MNKTLRLHTDSDGIVWCGQNGVRAINSKLVPEEFVAHNSFRTAKLVRIMGVHDNAELIVTAYNAQKKLNAARPPAKSALSIANVRLEVGSPLICPTKALRTDPVEVLQRMWQTDTAARLSSNWRAVDSNLFNSYLLSTSVDGVSDKSAAIFRYHPTSSIFKYLSEYDTNSCMKFVSAVLDPRWFLHPDRPHRMTRLNRFLGLTPSVFKGLFSESPFDVPGVHNVHRAFVVTSCWNVGNLDDVDYSAPHNFLWRIYRDRGYGWKGALAASISFVRFVSLQWRDKLSGSRRNLFDPSVYFYSQEEVDSYLYYVNSSQVQG